VTHNCQPMQDVIARHREFQIDLRVDIDFDKDIREFVLRKYEYDLRTGEFISINVIDYVRICPYCGDRFDSEGN